MSFLTTVTVKRGAALTVIQQHIPIQFDEGSPFLVGDIGGASPNIQYDVITMPGWVPDIRRQDYLIDELNIDLNTGQPAKYLVNGKPEIFTGSHLEAKAELIEGT